ncbi:hypothetical protein [Micromonospora sp. NPDC093277]|uniref:hypothetical protein n=1 Tax=Micromonospora sp. NPDC093277 TaxID=3364291 RepID=UPI00381040E2
MATSWLVGRLNAEKELGAIPYALWAFVGCEILLLLGFGTAARLLHERGRVDLARRAWLGWGVGLIALCAIPLLANMLSA